MSQSNYLSTFQLSRGSAIQSYMGVAIAFLILGLWATNLTLGLRLDLSQTPLLLSGAMFLLQAFLYTGLFITAHDSMHRSLLPQSPKWNDRIGAIAVFLYLFFPYQKLVKKHWLHHRYPASEHDPDFHNGRHTHPVFWYVNFLKRYFSWEQVIGILIFYHSMRDLLHVPEKNLLVFWILPSILSSLQLFYFGTFLPHRELPEGYGSSHRARSNNLTPFWSFLSCYHFGYHEEHHECPAVPWWQLPRIRKMRLEP